MTIAVRGRCGRMLRLLTLLPLFGFAAAPISSQPSQASANAGMEHEFQAAMAAEDHGDLDRAEAILSKLHSAHPGVFAVDESLGLLLASRGETSKALPLLETAVRVQPSSDSAHANLGAALYGLHRNQLAIHEFEQAVRINPSNFSSQQSLGRLWMESHRPDNAAKAFQAALGLKPDDGDLKLDCITALLGAGRVKEAQQMLSDFAGADQSARAQSLLGEVNEKEGNFESAGEHLARAAQLDPSEENAWQLGYEFLQHWTFDAAVTEFEAATAKFPDSKRMRLGLGAALYGDAQYARSIPVFADLLTSDPNNAMYAGLLGIACNAILQASSPRCAELISYAQAHPADAEAATYAATSLMTQDGDERNLELAHKFLEQAIADNPKLAEAQFQMGVILQDNSNWKGSIPYLERAVKLKPDLAAAHYRLARAYWRTGRKQEGQAQMELQKKFASEEDKDLERRNRQIYRFVVRVQ